MMLAPTCYVTAVVIVLSVPTISPADDSISVPPRPLAMSQSWQQRREALENQGVRVNAYINDQYQAVLKGGADSEGSGRNSGSLDVIIRFDLDKLGVIPSAEMLLHLQSMWGRGVNQRAGGLFQVNDDADGLNGGHVGQFWYRKHFLEHRVSLTIGYMDYQTTVDRNVFANSEDKQFMHQSLDNNPLIPLRIGMGISLLLRPVSWYSLTLGIADGQSIPYKGGISRAFHEDAWYTVYVENGFHVELSSQKGTLQGNYRLGLFYDPGSRKKFPKGKRDIRTRAGDYGMYVSLDQMLMRESMDDNQGLGVFARFGYRNPENNRMSRFWSAGLVYKGLVPTRNADVLGFGFSLLRSSSLYRERIDDNFDNETVYELYYAIHFSDRLVITPDIQYIDNPGANGEISHAIVAGLRVRMSL